MSDQLMKEAYDQIIQWLQENKLPWVAQQIEDEVIIGKPKHGRITTLPSPQIERGERIRETKKASIPGEFLTREDYASLEKLEIAIGAMNAVVVGAVKIQESLLKTLENGSVKPRVFFADPDKTTDEYHFRSDDLAHKKLGAVEIAKLLIQLEVEAKQ